MKVLWSNTMLGSWPFSLNSFSFLNAITAERFVSGFLILARISI